MSGGPILAFDTSSPLVSVAVAHGGRLLAERAGGQRESSAHLLGWVDALLSAAGVGRQELGGLVALAGPGSFTGLRVGLATALGIHQALGLPATTLTTFTALAAAAGPEAGEVLALVPALPGEWYAQRLRCGPLPARLGDPRRLASAELATLAAGADLLVATAGVDLAEPAKRTGVPRREVGPLASATAVLASLHPPAWDASLLSAPLYLAPPPATLPAAPKRVLAEPPARRGSR